MAGQYTSSSSKTIEWLEIGLTENERLRKVAEESRGKLEAMIRSLPEGDRKDLARRDREHPPLVFLGGEASPPAAR